MGKDEVSQKELSSKVFKNDYDNLLRSAGLAQEDWCRIKEQTRSGSSLWMVPSYVRGQLVIADECYPLLLRRHLGFQFFDDGIVTTCSRSDLPRAAQRQPCSEQQDPFLRHATEACRSIFVQRHNSVATTVKSLCKMAGIDYMSEVACIPGSNNVPADIYISEGPNEVPLAVDVAVVSPLAHSRMGSPDAPVGSSTAAQESVKIARYKALFDQMHGRIQFSPFVISTFGGMAQEAKAIMRFIAHRLSQRWVITFASATRIVYVRILNALMHFIGLSLSHALQGHLTQHPLA